MNVIGAYTRILLPGMLGNVIGAYTRILLPGMLGNSKWVTCWPMVLVVHIPPYIFVQMHMFLFPL